MKTLVSRGEQCKPAVNTGEWRSVIRQESSETQTIGVRYYEPENLMRTNELLIDGIAWSVHASKPRDVWRTGASAEATGMRTIGLEMPDMGPNSGPLTRSQRRALCKGDWSPLGQAQWDAITATLEAHEVDIDGMTVHFDGNSMSVSSNIGLIATAPENVKIGHVIAWEGLAWQPKSRLAKALNIAGIALRAPSMASKILRYQKLAGPIPEAVKQSLETDAPIRPEHKARPLRRIGQKLGSWLLPVVAMARGEDAHRLISALDGRDKSSTIVHLWNGEKSLVSRTRANDRGAALLRAAGIEVKREIDEDGRHLAEDNIPFSLERKLSVLARI